MHLQRTAQLLVVAAAAIPVAACGGSSNGSSVSAGNGSPGAAAVGFLSGFSKQDKKACTYVTPAAQQVCNQAIGKSAKITITNLKVGKVTTSGGKALVTILGKLCGTGAGGKPTCFTSSNATAGQPKTKAPADFTDTYNKVQTGAAGNQNPAIPCVQTGGKWYVNLGA
ncbi:MAG: hypothetical protein ACRDXE_09360 [Acidimicrobiales bacterium]